MPLTRREHTSPGDGDRQGQPALSSQDPDQRRHAARLLAGNAEGLPQLAAALASETVPAVREALLEAIAGTGSREAALILLPSLRSDDAGLRNGALSALQAMPSVMPVLLEGLLTDPDGDVRILATELARVLPPDAATGFLCRMLVREHHPNACAAAMDVLAQVGTPDAVPVLRDVAARFAADPFVRFAAHTAIARIEG